MTAITMPRLADGMEQGTIISWLVSDGDVIAAGDEIAEIETDKATMTYAAEAEGTITLVVAEGATVAVGEPIARLGDAAEVADQPEVIAPSAETTAPAPEPVGVLNGNGSEHGPTNGATAVVATPLARRIAAAHGVVLDGLDGSGPAGRITKADVLQAAGIELPAPSAPIPDAAPAPVAAPADGVTRREPTRLQQVVARRMTEAATTVPHFQVQTEVQMDAALELRAQLKAAAEDEPVPSVNDFIVKAAALALRDHPLVNGSFRDGGFDLHERVNVGVAIAADDGLVVATVEDADRKALGEIARDARRLAERVRAGTVTPADLAGQTFTVSNLGMFGMTAITAVINPPQAAILGVGAARDVLARSDDGEIVDRRLLTLTLSCDHRILNGADGSRYLLDVKRLLERPLRLAL